MTLVGKLPWAEPAHLVPYRACAQSPLATWTRPGWGLLIDCGVAPLSFEVNLTAVMRVRAADENVARQAVPRLAACLPVRVKF